MKHAIVVVLGLGLVSLPALPVRAQETASGPKKVAVLDFAARGVSAEIAANVADVVAVTLSQVEGYAVISKSDINAMLGFEQQKQMLGCTDPACLTEVGNALGVDMLVSGAVGKLGESITVTLSMMDIRNARPVGRAQEQVGKPAQLPAATRRAVGVMLGTKKPLRKLSGSGGLFVASEPEGATVSLDGVQQQGTTPLNIDKVSAGDHTVKVVSADLVREVPVLVEPDKIAKVSLTLAVVRVKFLSVPFDATVFVDSIERGTTPLLLTDVPARKHQIEFRKKGYTPHVEEALFELTAFRKAGGEAFEVKAQLMARPVVLELDSVPQGATIFVDGDEKGDTPGSARVMPGDHSVVLKLKGYKAYEHRIKIKPAEEPRLTPALVEFEAHRDYMDETSLRRTLTLVGSIAGGVAVALGTGLTTAGWVTQGKADDKYSAYQDEIQADRIASLKSDFDDLNGAARIEAGMGYAFLGVGSAALLGVLINELTYPQEPDYGKATRTTGEADGAPGKAPPTPQTPKAPGAGASVVPGGALLLIKGVF